MAAPFLLTDFTKTVHRTEYPAISPTRPELTQAGRSVLVTGGSDGIGLAIAKGFITAKASKVIVIGRSADKLARADVELKEHVEKTGNNTTVISEACDVTDRDQVGALWSKFQNEGITIDVLVLNSGRFTEPKTLFDLGYAELWSQFEGNVGGPFQFAEKFYKQPGDTPRVLLYVSTMSINHFYESQVPIAAARPGYGLTKNVSTLMMQLIAKDVDPEKFQVISFHPGNIFTAPFKDTGVTEDMFPFEKASLPAGFAVWAASEEARFLHGRFVWATWDVDELKSAELRKKLDENEFYLRLGVIGLHGGFKA